MNGHNARWVYVGVMALAILSTLACGIVGRGRSPAEMPLPEATQPAEATATPTPTAAPGGQSTGGGTPLPPSPPPPEDEGSGQEGTDTGEGEPPIEIEHADMDLAPCPEAGVTMLLKFSAVMKIQHEQAELTHILNDGLLFLTVGPGNGGIMPVESTAGGPIPYTMEGQMGPCSLQGGGSMTPSASGFCENGVVYLTIVEDWGPYQATLTCPDGSASFNSPPLGAMTHSGQDGRGEVFPLDRNFSDAGGAGHTTIRPFGEGSGEHIWTLYLEEVPIIDLTR